MNKHRFVWHDLNTKDIEGAKKFYGEIFNWRFESSDNGPYQHIKAGEHMIGGMRQMSAQEQMPTSWLGYITVDDVAAAVAKISGAGGKTYMPTTTMENVGTFAVVADPTGGVFSPWKSARPSEDVERHGPPDLFTFSWNELVTTDPAAAVPFYANVFGWEAQPVDMGPGGTYTLLQRPGVKNAKGEQVAAGGVMKSPPGVPYSFWLPYVQVDNTDQLSERAARLGARVTVPPTDIPNIGRFACWLDPQGASIAVIQMPRK
ncbi:MAG TPA: VOC family protein [Kofleriaceae bacterium]|nr:VOC family protein [Kofleriaceae bacterium]